MMNLKFLDGSSIYLFLMKKNYTVLILIFLISFRPSELTEQQKVIIWM